MADQSEANQPFPFILDHDGLLEARNVAVLILLDVGQITQNFLVVRAVMVQHMRPDEIFFPADIAVDICKKNAGMGAQADIWTGGA